MTTLTASLLALALTLAGQPNASNDVREAESQRLRALVAADYAALKLLLSRLPEIAVALLRAGGLTAGQDSRRDGRDKDVA